MEPQPLSRRDKTITLLLIVGAFLLIARPWLADLSVWRADTYLHDRDFKQGMKHLKRALFVAPKHPRANFVYGELLANGRKWTEAVPYLKRASEGDKTDWEAAYWYGLTLYNTGKPDEAVAPLELAVKAGGKAPYVRRMLEKARSGETTVVPAKGDKQ